MVHARAALEDAPTTLFDADEPAMAAAGLSAQVAHAATVEARAVEPWAAVGVELAANLVDSYHLLEIVARGDDLDAFLAEHVILGRRVLIKVLGAGAIARGEGRGFLAEAAALWALGHPAFPAVTEYGCALDGRPFVIMEYAEGAALAARLADGLLDPDLAIDLAEQIAVGLAAAHAKGLGHGALSAGCVHLCPDSAMPHGLRVKMAELAVGATAATEDSDLVVARALAAARPADDVAAAGELFARLAVAAGRNRPTAAASALERLAVAMRGPAPPTMVEVVSQLGRLSVAARLAAPETRTGLVGLAGPELAGLWQGALVFGGGVVLAALLGRLL